MPCPCGEPLPPRASIGGPSAIKLFGFSFPVGPVLLSSAMVHKILFVKLLKTGLVSSSPLEVLQSNPLTKVRFPGNSVLCQSPRLGNLMWAPERSTTVWEPFSLLLASVCGPPTVGMGFDFYCACAPSYHLAAAASLSLGLGCLWWVPAASWIVVQ